MRFVSKLALAAAAFALVGAAHAADLPTRKAPMAPAPAPVEPVFSWTGPYLGVFGGVNYSRIRSTDAVTGFNYPTLNGNGITAGGLAGYNFNFYNNFILGLEGEAGYDHKSSSNNYTINQAAYNASTVGEAEGRLRGRIGFTFNNFMIFGAGGGSVSDLSLTYNNATGVNQQITHWRAGVNIGGGIEWAFANHWILRGEYIYDRYGNTNYNYNGVNVAGFNARNVRYDESTARAAIAYKF